LIQVFPACENLQEVIIQKLPTKLDEPIAKHSQQEVLAQEMAKTAKEIEQAHRETGCRTRVG